MKDYFIKLFDYDRYANQLILGTILKANNPDKPVQLMAHLLAAQQVWLSRCKNEPAVSVVIWPDWKAGILQQMIDQNHRVWINFLDYLSPDDFGTIISYKNTKGDSYETKLTEILTHIINHGTHHRAQIGQLIKSAGIELPPTDFILFIRETDH